MTSITSHDNESKINKSFIRLPDENGQNKNHLAFVLDNVFTKKECEDLITISNNVGYTAALINTGSNEQVLDTTIRNNLRCIINDSELSNQLWQKIKQFIPEIFKGKKIIGINNK